MSRNLYMHTIDGKPAEYRDAGIYFAGTKVYRFATSLKQIRREQQKAIASRNKYGWPKMDYGYVLLKIPDTE